MTGVSRRTTSSFLRATRRTAKQATTFGYRVADFSRRPWLAVYTTTLSVDAFAVPGEGIRSIDVTLSVLTPMHPFHPLLRRPVRRRRISQTARAHLFRSPRHNRRICPIRSAPRLSSDALITGVAGGNSARQWLPRRPLSWK